MVLPSLCYPVGAEQYDLCDDLAHVSWAEYFRENLYGVAHVIGWGPSSTICAII